MGLPNTASFPFPGEVPISKTLFRLLRPSQDLLGGKPKWQQSINDKVAFDSKMEGPPLEPHWGRQSHKGSGI